MIFDSGELDFGVDSFDQPAAYSVMGFEGENNCHQVQDLFDMIRGDSLQPLIERELSEPADWQNISVNASSTSLDLDVLASQQESKNRMEKFDTPNSELQKVDLRDESQHLRKRPQFKRRKSNPFYSPSRHIKNMITKDKQRKYSEKSERSEQTNDEQSPPGEMCNRRTVKPFLERRQTVG